MAIAVTFLLSTVLLAWVLASFLDMAEPRYFSQHRRPHFDRARQCTMTVRDSIIENTRNASTEAPEPFSVQPHAEQSTPAKRDKDNQDQLARDLIRLQKALGHLRLTAEYHVFDLEATCRENDDARELLDRNGR